MLFTGVRRFDLFSARARGLVVFAATALGILTLTAAAHASPRAREAPVHMAGRAGIANKYIVELKGALPIMPTKQSESQATAEDESVAASVHAAPLFVYNAAIKGFAADLTQAQLRDLRQSAQVKYIEQGTRVEETYTQTDAPWDLDRIDQHGLPLNGLYNYTSEGAGVHVYVIDTGLQANHPDFGSRASNAYNAVGGPNTDCNGHGTHVAGTVGGTTYGVAKLATLVGIKVLNCDGKGNTLAVIAGVNWVTEHHVADKSVANMSLSGPGDALEDDAVNRMIRSGVFVSVAAGNKNADACNFSPARVPAAFTVAASEYQPYFPTVDLRASFSNWGPCVDAYAPGVNVPSDWIGSTTKTISGTSMAAPVVAGIAALYLSLHPSTPADTSAWIIDHATTGSIFNNVANTVNRVVYKSDL